MHTVASYIALHKPGKTMRRAAMVDANQADIVKALRAVHATVQLLNAVGDGCPDLLVGFSGWNFVFEVKDPAKEPRKRKLRPGQQEWFDEWRGDVLKIEHAHEAIHHMQVHVRRYGAR